MEWINFTNSDCNTTKYLYPKSYCTITYSDQNLDPSKVQILDHFEDSISKKSNLFWHLKIGQKRIFLLLEVGQNGQNKNLENQSKLKLAKIAIGNIHTHIKT